METIRILVYTDYEAINQGEELYNWSISELTKFALFKTRTIAHFTIDLEHRFSAKLQTKQLTADFLSPYQELWVLGFNSDRTSPFELNTEEIEALENWMNKGGGLMFAGDHAAGLCGVGDPLTFGVHGRSLGEPMKRAGQLRVWQGPPTACKDKPLKERDNLNSCEGNNPQRLDDIRSQSDGAAARLLTLSGPPHPLFWFDKGPHGGHIPIERFPDHPHESSLAIPEHDKWPANSPPPVVAAMVRDRRFPAEQKDFPVVVAFDGDVAVPVVGRIVADSSFHHYLNINLIGLRGRDSAGLPTPNSDLDQIAQFYGNLALWLTPHHLRQDFKVGLFFRLAVDPDVFEARGTGYVNLGSVGQYALDLRIGEGALYRLLAFTSLEKKYPGLDKLIAAVFLGDSSVSKLSESARMKILGAIIQAHHDFFAAHGAITPAWLKEKPDPTEMIRKGLELIQNLEPSVYDELLPLLYSAS